MKKALVLLLSFTMPLLTGCSTLDSKLEQKILEKSGILENEDYLQYQQYLEASRLNENGEYVEPNQGDTAAESQEQSEGQIHVTFAENRYLNIWYFTDSAMATPINPENCYVNPGDTLYAKVIECNNPNSNLYKLAEYRIVEYDNDGNVEKQHQQTVTDGILEYEIPSNVGGTEMSSFQLVNILIEIFR